MNVDVPAGKYVVAVSGGVDSVVLLDLLTKLADITVTVAHFDHGIRSDSVEDATFVAELAKKYGLDYVTQRAELGKSASEAIAREARYTFLREVQSQIGASAIITAHHQDDVLETAIMNLLRGTGRRGLTSLQSQPDLLRPMLAYTKKDITEYASQHKLSWREDSTNYETRYTRNYIRLQLLANWDADSRRQLLALINQQTVNNEELDSKLAQLMAVKVGPEGLNRKWFLQLPHGVAAEVMTSWLRSEGLADFDRPAITRLVVGCKTKAPGKRLDVLHGRQITITPEYLALTPAER